MANNKKQRGAAESDPVSKDYTENAGNEHNEARKRIKEMNKEDSFWGILRKSYNETVKSMLERNENAKNRK